MKSNIYRKKWEVYTNLWSDTNSDSRKNVLELNLAIDCICTIPNAQIAGLDALSNYINQFQEKLPGAKFITTNFNEHHNQSLAHWDILDNENKILKKGASFAIYLPDGKISHISAFFF